MDQMKTGAFIAALRKEKGMTQKDLADSLSVSDRTVSRWETGTGMPEVSLMLPLCEELGISVNELLLAERIPDTEKEMRAEKLMMDLVSEREENRRKVILAVIIGGLTIGAGMLLSLSTVIFEMSSSMRTFYMTVGLLVMFGGIGVCAFLDMHSGTYECSYCSHRFVPTAAAYLMGAHTISKRYLKCPSCGRSGMFRRRLTH